MLAQWLALDPAPTPILSHQCKIKRHHRQLNLISICWCVSCSPHWMNLTWFNWIGIGPKGISQNEAALSMFVHCYEFELQLTNFHRSRFVQGLLLSTLSLDEENDPDGGESAEHIAPESNLDTSNTTGVLASDSTASRQPAQDFNESKKKQETATHSDIPQNLSGKFSRKHCPRLEWQEPYNYLCSFICRTAAQQRGSSKPKTGSSKSSQQSPATQQSVKSSRVSMPSDAR